MTRLARHAANTTGEDMECIKKYLNDLKLDEDAMYWHVENGTEVRGKKGFLVCDLKDCEFDYDIKLIAELIAQVPFMYAVLKIVANGDMSRSFGLHMDQNIAQSAITRLELAIRGTEMGF